MVAREADSLNPRNHKQTKRMKSAWKDWHTKKEGVVEPEVEKLEELFKENNARRILDVGCGAGRHTFYFARKRFEVYGFDEDQDVIENDKQILRQKSSRPTSGSGI
jgi:2-polyprenyl-3-methyl-5-hydroxy-6-metoxy-1,4-benzoquinol methylase